MTKINFEEFTTLLKENRGKFLGFTFNKVDGTVRTINCRASFTATGELSTTLDGFLNVKLTKKRPDGSQYAKVNLREIKSFTCGGKQYQITKRWK